MAVCKAVGKVIAESGGTYFLNDLEIIQAGSTKSFPTCKNYNRAKTGHETLALAMEILHFRCFFLSKCNNEKSHYSDLLKNEVGTLTSLDFSSELANEIGLIMKILLLRLLLVTMVKQQNIG